jgi:hypothetical protein
MGGDPFAPARRATWQGPLLMLLGGGMIYLGVEWGGFALALCILGGLVALFGLILFAVGTGSQLRERRRRRILREGVPSTATVRSIEEVRPDPRNPIYKMSFAVALPSGGTRDVERLGAIEVQYAGSIAVGTELPIRMDPDEPEHFAVDWQSL